FDEDNALGKRDGIETGLRAWCAAIEQGLMSVAHSGKVSFEAPHFRAQRFHLLRKPRTIIAVLAHNEIMKVLTLLCRKPVVVVSAAAGFALPFTEYTNAYSQEWQHLLGLAAVSS